MNEQEWMEKLKQEGFTDIETRPIPTGDFPEHTHDQHTVHVILDGELTIVASEDTRVFRAGDRVEFPAGTTHKSKGTSGRMIIGVKP